MGEHLAYASLVASGYAVRLSGEDSARGTFTHRHAVLHDQNRERWDEGTYTPLQHVADGQAPFVVIDSLLSEEAVLGFEYGYASAEPNTLVIWEAQFGDFVNGAQVVVDQFIASGEVKWGRANGLTLMLPHGYEGQGPEHSSARIERFMQLSADNNMQVVQPTSASQIFHVLRRQMVRMFRKPLIIMTPKSLLRAKDASSPLTDFTKGEFKTVIGEQSTELNVDKVKRVIACSGKVYYDLIRTRADEEATDVAIIRVEQLYPFPHKAFAAELKKYPNATEVVWCQDEPQNQGAWFFVQHYIHENMSEGQRLGYAGRAPSSSPAVGYAHLHQEQQKALLEQAFGKLKGFVAFQVSRARRKNNKANEMSLIEVKVPQLSESVAEATLLQWKKKPGQAVEMDEILVEIETDKVVLEVPAPAAGVLAQIIKNDGDTCISEEVIAKIDTEGAGSGVGGDADQEHPAGRAGAGRKARRSARGRGAGREHQRAGDAGRRQADGRARRRAAVGRPAPAATAASPRATCSKRWRAATPSRRARRRRRCSRSRLPPRRRCPGRAQPRRR